MNDIVYMLKDPLPDNGVELGYSLRSLKNIPHGKVFMVTPTLPEWINPDTVEHVSHLPVHSQKYNDLGEKWRWLGTNDVMSDEVIYMDDDFYIVRQITRAGPRPNFHPLEVVIQYYYEKTGGRPGGVEVALRNCMRLLREKGIRQPNHPIQHYPWPVERDNIPVHWEDGRGPYDWKILEFNHNYPDPPEYWHESKIRTKVDLRNVAKRGTPYMSSVDGATMITSGLLGLLQKMFPEPSIHERD
jgi:hypothetical protein